jgi:hypothetical protein
VTGAQGAAQGGAEAADFDARRSGSGRFERRHWRRWARRPPTGRARTTTWSGGNDVYRERNRMGLQLQLGFLLLYIVYFCRWPACHTYTGDG